MIETVAASPARPFPAELVHIVGVQQAERVTVAVGLKAAEERELCLIPALAALRAQPAVAISSKQSTSAPSSRSASACCGRRLTRPARFQLASSIDGSGLLAKGNSAIPDRTGSHAQPPSSGSGW